MSRKVFVGAVLLFAVLIFGCFEQEVKDDPRFRADPAQAEKVTGEGFAVPGAEEIDLVEDMTGRRNSYRASLKALIDFYEASGDATKLAWAQREYALMPQYRYLMPGEALKADLQATDSIEVADELYAEALTLYKEAGGLLIIVDEEKLRVSLSKFNLLIENYPSSDKIDDAAYKAGRIYNYFQDYEIAAVYFQRAFQWDKNTPYPARFRAAYILDRRLNMKVEALVLYQLSLEKESRYEDNAEFARRRVRNLTRPMKQEDEEDEPEEEAEGEEAKS
jgi:tetratricopeptide (TPR) repeat protein